MTNDTIASADGDARQVGDTLPEAAAAPLLLWPDGWPETTGVAARREAARALALLWLGREVGRISTAPRERYLDGTRVPQTPTDRFTAAEAEAVVHLAGYEGALRAGWPAGRPPGPDPDFRLAEAVLPPGARPLKALQALVQRHLDARTSEFYALVFALQDRGALSADEVRRVVLRSRLRRRDGFGRRFPLPT